MDIREQIASKEHDQWMRWAKSLVTELKQLTTLHLPYGDVREAGNCHCKTCERIKRWESLFIPYTELTEAQKDQDRAEADQILALFHQWAKEQGWQSAEDCKQCEQRQIDAERIMNREANFEEQRLRGEVEYWKDKNYSREW